MMAREDGVSLRLTGAIIIGIVLSIAGGIITNAWANGKRDAEIEELKRRANYYEPKVDDILKKVSYLYERAKERPP